MSWFDKLFGENNHSDSDVFFRKTRRQHSKHQLNSEDSLLPENNDIYERPKGKFRFPMNISDNEVQDDISSTDNVNEHNNNRRRQTYQSDFTTGQAHTHRRRHRNYTGSGQRATSSHDDRHKEQSHADSQSRLKKQASAYATQQTSPHSHYSSTKPRFKLQSERIKSSANEAKPTYQAHSFKASEVPSAIFGTKKDVQLKMVSFLMLSMISVMMKAEITINNKLKLKEIHSNQCSQLRLKIRINKVNTMMRQRIAMIL